jgi:hypothetical protein
MHPQRQIYKHLFRHSEDITFDIWLRCAKPQEVLGSVGYTTEEMEELSRDYPPLLSLNVHDKLAPIVQSLVETMGGGTGRMTWRNEMTKKRPGLLPYTMMRPNNRSRMSVEPHHAHLVLDGTWLVAPWKIFSTVQQSSVLSTIFGCDSIA